MAQDSPPENTATTGIRHNELDDLSVEDLTAMINRLLSVRERRQEQLANAGAEPQVTNHAAEPTGNPPQGNPTTTARITTTVIMSTQESGQSTETTQTVVIPILPVTPVNSPRRPLRGSTLPAPQITGPGTVQAYRVHTHAWYSVTRAREVGVIYDWYNVWPLVYGIVPWHAKRYGTQELAQHAYDEKVARGEVERVDG